MKVFKRIERWLAIRRKWAATKETMRGQWNKDLPTALTTTGSIQGPGK